MILENLAHLLSKDNTKQQQQEITPSTPIDADKMRMTRNKFAKLSREKKFS